LKVLFREATLSTRERTEIIDLTSQVERYVRESGICLVSTLHSTTALLINENEKGLLRDIIRRVKEEFPRGAGRDHDRMDDNADAHLASTFLGNSRMLPVKDGRLVRGAWQSILFLELDGPRGRNVIFEILGE
jgi:secondary thiamine-phosphate synthase enzyme